LSLLLKAAVPSVPSNTWAPTGEMLAGRAGAASTLLYDGRVLVTGGLTSDGVATASVERYSPIAGAFLAAPPMETARANHSATLLPDGRVLVAGGVDRDGRATSGVEIYDPRANAWMSGAPMYRARAGHTATPMWDGRVLIAGGDDAGVATDSLEIFDPYEGVFSLAGPMLSNPRTGHAAALSYYGRVVIAGGFDGAHALASVDVYDPYENTVSSGAPLATARAGHSATTLIDGKMLFVGGAGDSNEIGSAEIYDPVRNTMTTAIGSLRAARQHHQAILLPHNSAVLIVGGTSAGHAVAVAELYVPWHNDERAFVAASAPSAARAWATGAALSFPAGLTIRTGPHDGLALLAGGSASPDASNPTRSAELYGFATVKTDLADYAPGMTVTITGSGWQPGERVTLTLKESPDVDEHQPIVVEADDNGNIVNTDFTPDEHDLYVRFYLTAVGSASGAEAQTTFTDANPGTVTLAPASATVAPGSTATYTVTVGFSGNSSVSCTVNLSASGVPTGASPTFTPASLTSTGASKNSTLTITTNSTTTPSGTYTITVTATPTAGTCQNPASVTGTGTLLVSGPPTITSASSTTFAAGQAGSFTVTATGTPAPTFSESGALPSGVTLNTSTGVLSGTPAGGTNGTYAITFTASNGISPNATQNFTLTVDNQPTVTINQAGGQSDPTNASPLNFTAVFNTSVTGFGNGDVTIGGTAGGTKTVTVTGSGTTYNVAVSGMTAGTVTASIPANAAQSASGLGNAASTATDNTVTYEVTAPGTASTVTPANGSTFRAATVPASFSGSAADNSGGVGLNANSATFTLQRGSDNMFWNGSSWQAAGFNLATTHVATTSNTAATWTSSATMPTWASESDGTYTVQATATDKAGNTLTGTAVTFTLDSTAPATASVTTPANGSTFAAGTVPATFGGSAADNSGGAGLAANTTTFTLQRASDAFYWNASTLAFQSTAVNLSTAHAATTSGTAASWTDGVTLPTWSSQADGTYIVAAKATDKAGNTFTGSASSFTLDRTAPTAAISYAPTGAVKQGTSLTITATFSEPMADSPAVKIAISGANTLAATGMTKVDSTHYTYTHTVGAGTGAATVALSVGTDLAGNVITSGPTSGASFTVDNTAPTASIAYSPTGSVRQGTTVTITATFSEAMGDSPVPKLAISAVTGGTALAATDMTKVDSTHYTYAYTVQSGNGTATVTMSSGTDIVGNVITSAPASGGSFTVDNTAPTVTIGAPSVTTTAAGPVTYTVTYSGASSVTLAAADITLNAVGAAGSVAVSGTGTTTRTVTLSGITGNGTLGISIAAGTALDGAGNTAAAAGPGTTFVVDNTPPALASVTAPVNGTTYQVSTVPATFSGSAADSAGGVGLNSNSTTFTLRRGSDSFYWTGSAWQAGVFQLSTTHGATTSGTSTTWTDAVALPAWSADSFTVLPTATDKLGNTFTGDALSFTVAGVFPTSLGTHASGNSTESSFTQTGITVAAGNTIFVAIAVDPTTAAFTVTDSAGNSYTKDADKTNGSVTSGVRSLVFSAPVATALSSGTITVATSPSTGVNVAATFFSVNGLVSASPADKSKTATGNGLTPNSGATATTSQADELLIGALAIEDKNPAVTEAAGFTKLSLSSVTSGQAPHYVAMQPEYELVHSAAAYSAGGTLDTSAKWSAVIVTYRVRVPSVQSIARADSDDRLVGASVDFTVAFSENVFDVDAADFALAGTAASGASITSLTGSGAARTVTVATGSGGTLGLNLVDDDSIIGINGNPLAGTGTGNGNYTGESYTIKTPTTTTLSSSNATVDVGDAVTFTATVSPASGSGTVAFKDGGEDITNCAAASIAAGQATCTTSSLTSGSHSITATYSGDSAFAGSTSSAMTETVNAVAATAVAVAPATGTYGGTTVLSATLTRTSNGSAVSGKSVSFTLDGTSVGSATTDASGVAELSDVSLTGIDAQTYPAGVAASFGGDANFGSSNGSATLTISQANQTITFAALADKTYGDADFAVSATASSGLAVSFAVGAGDACTITGNMVHLSGVGSCAVTASQAGDGNYSAAEPVGRTFGIGAKAVTVTADAKSKTYGAGDPALTYQVTSGALETGDSFTGALGRAAGENVGTHAIGQGTLALNANYALNFVGADLTIAARAIAVTGVTAANKVYDGTTIAAVNAASAALAGVLGTDAVSLSGTASGSFASKTVGSNKPVTVTGFTLAGDDAGNYSLSQPAGLTASITPIGLTATVTADSKPYDGNATATAHGTLGAGVLEGDVVDVVVTSALFNNASIGDNKPVTANLGLNGADASNYTVNATATTTASITAITLRAQFTNPLDNATNIDVSQPFTWTAVPGVEAYYLYAGTTQGAKNVVNTGELHTTSYGASNVPFGVTLYGRLWTKVAGVWRYVDITFTAGSGSTLSFNYPPAGSTSADLTQPFEWAAVANAQAYYLYVGTALGQNNLVNSGEIQTTSYLATNLPLNQPIYVRLWVKVGGAWSYVDRTITATATVATVAQFTAPTNGATNVSPAQPMQWTTIAGAQAYYLYVGTSVGASNVVNSGELQTTSYVPWQLPAGQLLYARLWTKASVWRYTDITFMAAAANPVFKATVISPVDGATNVDAAGFIQWTPVPNAQTYYVYVGTTPGAMDLIDSQEICDGCHGSGMVTQWSMTDAGKAPAAGLAGMAGQKVYLRLWTRLGDVWRYVDSSFTLAP
jgi:YDG domain/Bacterial Ig-like domain (group 3)/MBG domain (YGX type)/Kelch motif